jgi:hypothetical protein
MDRGAEGMPVSLTPEIALANEQLFMGDSLG